VHDIEFVRLKGNDKPERHRRYHVDPQDLRRGATQRRLIARAAKIGRAWPKLPGPRQRAFLTALIERIAVGVNQIDIHLHPTRLGAILDVAAAPSEEETQILSIPVQLRRSGREITMVINGIDPFGTPKPDARLVKLLIKARRFNAALL